MKFDEINTLIQAHFDDATIIQAEENGLQPCLIIKSESLINICEFLHTNNALFFDFLNCITAIDNGLEKNTMELIYHISSLPFGHTIVLKVFINRSTEPLPTIPTVSTIWKTALWHEREAYDLMGIHFEGHPDLRRILLPTDWVGFPLRKDYQEQERYHGIKIKY